jgi:hypothetical protein
MASVIHRTARDSNGCLLYLESVNTPDYDTDDWLINPDLSGVSGVECYYWKVTGTPPGGSVVEMDAGEKAAVDATRLANAKTAKKTALVDAGDAYVSQRYPNWAQLDALYADAVRDRPNRYGYLLPYVKWREKVSADVKAKQDDVDAALTVSAVNAIELDTTTLDSEDPSVTVNAAVAKADTQSLTSFLDANAKVTDPSTNISGAFWLMQLMMNRREIFNDNENPLYDPTLTPLIGAGGSVTNLNDIHAKMGWHRQEVFKQGWRRPTDVLFYYGYPNSYNSAVNAWNNEKVAQDMARYGIVVLGDGVQNPTHPDYANTQVIVPRIQALNPCAKVFGYVSVNQSFANFKTKVDQWEVLEVDGIFMDEAGYDYGSVATNGRVAFNEKVDYVHTLIDPASSSSGSVDESEMIVFANAWNTDHILGTANDGSYPNSTWNPGAVESSLDQNDWILLESLAVNTTAYSGNAGYASKSDWAARVTKMQALRATYGVNFASVGIINDDNANGQDLFDFAFVSAMMAALEGNGTSSNLYGASTAQVAHWTRPDTTKIGEAWNLNASIQVDAGDADVYHRYTEFAKLSLDFSTGAQASTIALS